MAKFGRNELCPCGSGKKYKHCCIEKEAPFFVTEGAWRQDPDWHRIRLAEAETIYGILQFAARQYGEDFLVEAVKEFSILGEYPVNEELVDSILIPWVAFTWIHKSDKRGPAGVAAADTPMGFDYLDENISRLDGYQRRFILTACAQPFSFWAVTGVVAGKSLELHDIFLDRTIVVKEVKASATLKRGDIIFARVVPLDGQAIVVGMGPTAIPPREHVRLLDIRNEIKRDMRAEGFALNLASLLEWDFELRAIYLSAVEYLANPPRPQLQNTDGDPISFVTLSFELNCPPQEAFDALRALSLESGEGNLEDAIYDDSENLLEVSFNWLRKGNKKHKSWENTILGSLEIKGNALTVEVNSEKRAKKIQTEVTKRLGKRVVFKSAVNEPLEAKLEEMKAQSNTTAFEERQREQEEFASRPEVQALLEQQMKAHWKGGTTSGYRPFRTRPRFKLRGQKPAASDWRRCSSILSARTKRWISPFCESTYRPCAKSLDCKESLTPIAASPPQVENRETSDA